MSRSRLSQALEDGAIVLPDSGRVAVLGPRAETDLSALPRDRTQVIQGFRPDHDVLAAQGYDTVPEPSGDFVAAIVFLPRAKAQARALIAEAATLAGGGPLVIDGQKTDGVESLLKECRAHGVVGAVVSKAHGKLFTVSGGEFADWAAAPEDMVIEGEYVTRPGVFSADAVDPGSAALAAALPGDLRGRVADLGAGWGYLSRAILSHERVTELHLIEAEHAALECARRNIDDPRAQFHWADATAFRPEDPLDAVVTNPPFHTSRAPDPSLGRAFIAAAAVMLKPSGRLYLVANRHLPYETAAQDAFREVREIGGEGGFKILLAAKPRRGRG